MALKNNHKAKSTTPQMPISVKKPVGLPQSSDKNDSSGSNPEKSSVAPVKETVVFKKLKPRGIDSVFIEHKYVE